MDLLNIDSWICSGSWVDDTDLKTELQNYYHEERIY